jgi:ATP/maltotriose-dependent transcriptional regulator MalT/DNA-binding SARP family transcriptional activator
MGRTVALPAKLVRPTQAGAVRRPRLFALLDRARPIAWVSGPPGAGKTTLVASYVEARRLRPLWYQMDAGDGDVATVFYYLRLAALRAVPRRRWRLPLLTPEYMAGLDTFSRRWFEELFAGLPRPFVLVFDNYHEVGADSPFHAVIRGALETLPPGGRAIFVSRGDPPPALARLRADGKLALIDWDALRLTAAETAEIARARTGALSGRRARALHAATEGWAAGLVLMLERAAGDHARMIDQGLLPQAVFDYFAAEILARSDAETRQVLFETSLLPKVTAAQAQILTGKPRSAAILAALTRRRYFTDVHAEPEPTYQYHPLFRQFLLTRAREQLSPQRCDELLRKAASLLEQSGQAEDAAELLREVQDWQALARLALVTAPALLANGRSVTLERWLRALPAEVLAASPWLLYWFGACRLPVSPKEAAIHADRAFNGFAAEGNRVASLTAAALAIASILDEWSDLSRLDPWIARVEESLSQRSKELPPEVEAQGIGSLFAALIWRRPDHPNIAEWAARAEASFRATRDPAFRGRLGVSLGHYFMWAGEIDVAGNIAESLAGPGTESRTSIVTRLWTLLLQTQLAWIKADVPRCRDTAARALALAAEEGVRVLDLVLIQAATYGQLVAGDVSPAQRSLQRIRADIGETQFTRLAQFYYLSSWAAFLEGDLPAAHAHGESGERLAAESGVPFGVMVCRLAVAQTLFERGDHRGARERLADSLRIARSIRSKHVEQMCLLVEADFALRRGDEPAGLASVRTAFGLGREYGFLAGGFWRRDLAARLCTRAFAAGIELDYARRLVLVHHLQPDPTEPPPEAWPWPIRIRALGRFQVEIHDQPVSFSTKAQRKPFALLKALVAFGGRSVRERDIADALWPEADGDAALQALAVTLHRLRRLLRDESAVHRQDGRMQLDPQRVWSDVAALESTLHLAANAPPAERLRLLDAALQLYAGPLLPDDEDEGWTAAPRQRLRARVLREVQETGRVQEVADPDAAARCYLKVLEVDDRAEELYRHLIALYQRLGRRAEALAVYERCHTALRVAVGVAPSPETEALVRTLRG